MIEYIANFAHSRRTQAVGLVYYTLGFFLSKGMHMQRSKIKEHIQWAMAHNLSRMTGESDADFAQRIDGIRYTARLRVRARELSAKVPRNASAKQLEDSIFAQLLALLKTRGVTPNAEVTLGTDRRKVKITRIDINEKKQKVTVHYWILDWPVDKKNNKGRANHQSADTFLRNLEQGSN